MKGDSQLILALFSTKYFANSARLRDEDPINASALMFSLLAASEFDMPRLSIVFRQLADTDCAWTYTFYDELLLAINTERLLTHAPENRIHH